MKSKNEKYTDEWWKKENLLNEDNFDPNEFPLLYNLSAAFIYQFIPKPKDNQLPEYVYVNDYCDKERPRDSKIKLKLAIAEWNTMWEAGHLRYDVFWHKLPKSLGWLKRFADKNIYLLPNNPNKQYYTYEPLFHLLPFKTRKHSGLPLIKKGRWPFSMDFGWYNNYLPTDFNDRLSKAFAFHLWPLLISGSKPSAFSKNDPIKILAHNLDYWLPYAYSFIEKQLGTHGRIPIENKEQEKEFKKIKKNIPQEVKVCRPLIGGPIWQGEEEAWNATKEIVEIADKNGELRNIIDAVKSNRIKDDFSNEWSYAKEDFERRIFKKRSKIKVTFVELHDTPPVHGPYSELHENLLWEDFLGLLDTKEKRIVVCLRSGITKMGEISRILGYANHSPVSKALSKIRKKALKYINQ